MKLQFRDGARLGAQATRRSDGQARERRPLVGTARRRRAAGRTPSSGVVRLSAGTPAFSVIRAAGWYTPFAALRAAVPTRGLYLSGHHFFMGQTPCERKAPAGVRWGAAGSREAASRGGRRRRFRRSLACGAIRTVEVPGGAAFSQQLPRGRCSLACASLRLVAWAPCAMFSVRVAPSATPRALPSMRNAG